MKRKALVKPTGALDSNASYEIILAKRCGRVIEIVDGKI